MPATDSPLKKAPVMPTWQQNPLPKLPFHRDHASLAQTGAPSMLPMQLLAGDCTDPRSAYFREIVRNMPVAHHSGNRLSLSAFRRPCRRKMKGNRTPPHMTACRMGRTRLQRPARPATAARRLEG